MKRGRERAELRTAALRRLLLELEAKRDRLLDEVAFKKGEAEAAEATIKRIHELVLDINKEEKHAEEMELELERKKLERQAEKEANQPRKEKVEQTLKGAKNSKKGKQTSERARRARAKRLSE